MNCIVSLFISNYNYILTFSLQYVDDNCLCLKFFNEYMIYLFITIYKHPLTVCLVTKLQLERSPMKILFSSFILN